MSSLSLRHRMTSIVWPTHHKLLKQSLLVLLGSVLIAAFSQVTIPIQPVPITLQNFAVMIIACLYGWRLGAATVALYLFEGAMGLPVFADLNFGFIHLVGPTGGYLWGFLPAVIATGFLLERGWVQSRVTAFLAALVGDAVILTLGVLMLSHFVGFAQAIALGLMPFVGVEVVKLAILGFVIPKFWK